MTKRVLWSAGLATILCALVSAGAQQPQVLVAGLNQEHTLGPGENHVYTITLHEGEAVVGEADQHGVDLVIDEFSPDGKLIRTVDSPNGTEGPEPIDVSAFAPGEYKLVIHTLDPTAKPGKYVMKVDHVLTVDQNGSRLAEKNYPLAIQDLWRKYASDPNALEHFISGRKGKGPIVENIKDDAKNVNVTFLYLGDEHTEAVEVFGSTHSGVGGTHLQRFLRTPLFFGTETIPKDSRFSYGFIKTERRLLGPKGNIEVSDELDVADPLNPNGFNGFSAMALPDAPPQPYVVVSDSVPHGSTTTLTLKSTSLKEDRNISVYTPPHYETAKAADLLIVFDGGTYDGGGASLVPTPTILDNLIAAKKIGPAIAIFVNNMGQRNRDLGGYPPFSDFIANELIPWARTNYRVNNGPNHVVLAGSSRGGVAAAHCAFYHSDVVGNVLSQSGAFWVRNGPEDNAMPWPITLDIGDIVITYRESRRLPIRFYMEVGRYDALLGDNREMRDVLLLKGYPVTYREFDSGHDYLWWRGSLADGLIALLGAQQN